MIRKYKLSGQVRGSGKRVSSYVSAPLGVSVADFNQAIAAYVIAFENVKLEMEGM